MISIDTSNNILFDSKEMRNGSDEISAYIERRSISGELLVVLEGLSELDRGVFSLLLGELDPSANMLRGIYRLVNESAKRDGVSMASVFSDVDCESLVRAGGSTGQRLERLSACLSDRRYPEQALLRKKLDLLKASLLRRYGISLCLPEALEGDTLQLKIKFRSVEELSKKATSLQALSEDSELGEMFSVLLGSYENF